MFSPLFDAFYRFTSSAQEQFVMPEPEAYPDRLLERLVSGFEGENVETKVEPVAFRALASP